MDWKRIVKKLFFPPLWVVIVLNIFSIGTLVFIFVKGWELLPIASIVYVASFYSLSVFGILCYKTLPSYYKSMKKKVYKNKYAKRYFTDVVFKTYVNLYSSLVINLIYITINIVSSIVYHTYWFAIFAVYYAIMAMMRFLLVYYVRKNHMGENRLGELKCSCLCAYILMTVNLILSGIVLMMVYFDKGFQYQGFLIYVMAMYTFYIVITTMMDMVKYRKYKSPIMSISKIIKMASSLFSLLFLETAMFSQFGAETSPETKQIMIMATGGGISIIVVVMSVYMIIRLKKEMRIYRKGVKQCEK